MVSVYTRCGPSPGIVEMTGSDAEIVCGEWQTGDYPQSESGELYNIHLDIKQIVRHPQYNVMVRLSAFLQYDIAAFKVDETQLSPVRSMVKCLRQEVTKSSFLCFHCFNVSTFLLTGLLYRQMQSSTISYLLPGCDGQAPAVPSVSPPATEGQQ